MLLFRTVGEHFSVYPPSLDCTGKIFSQTKQKSPNRLSKYRFFALLTAAYRLSLLAANISLSFTTNGSLT